MSASAVYNPITQQEQEAGYDLKKWKEKYKLPQMGFRGMLLFMLKKTPKDICRKKCNFILGFLSVFIVVLVCLVINSVISKGPVIFLRLAEETSGEIDAIITSFADENSYDTEPSYFLNYT